MEKPEAYAGKTVLWGGEILRVENAKEGTTLEILEVPTDSAGEPKKRTDTQGRYLIFTERYLDPAVYRSGGQLTTVGLIKGKIVRPLESGKMDYTYPFLIARYIYLWPLVQPPLFLGPSVGAGGWGPGGSYGGGVGMGVGFGSW